MLEPNKYLKKLGITNKSEWLFAEREKGKEKRFQVGKDGFCKAEFYNLDYTFTLAIYSHLCYFRDHAAPYSYPHWLKNEDEWIAMLQDIIDGFERFILYFYSEKGDEYKKAKEIKDEDRRKLEDEINDGLIAAIKKLADIWRDLWY